MKHSKLTVSATLTVILTAFFVVTETLIGIRFQTGGSPGAELRFLTVAFACAFCTLCAERSPVYLLTQLGLCLTVAADYFLVLPPSPIQLPGMLFFSVAQLAYAARLFLTETSPKRRRIQLWLRVSLSIAAPAATFIVLGASADPVAVVSVFYYAHLILNLIFAWMQYPREGLLSFGFLLFLGCDTAIGLQALNSYFDISPNSVLYTLLHPGFDLVWAFYLPSQMLLGMSLLPRRLSAQMRKKS